MAWTEITVENLDRTGSIDPSYVAAVLTDGNRFKNTGNEIIHIKNGGGGGIVVTLPTPQTVAGGLTVQDPTFAVGAGSEVFIAQLDPAFFNQLAGTTDAGDCYIEYDIITSVTLAVFKN